ncbi:MAG: oligosaccharide flippase family protein [Clostridiaceae bacterium]
MGTKSTTKGFAILSVSTILVKLLSLVYVPFLILIIGTKGYATYYAAYTIFVFIFVVVTAGIPVTISKQVSELVALNNYKDAIKTFKIARFILLIFGTILTVAMMLFARPLASFINFKTAYLCVLVLSPTVLFTSVSTCYMGYFQGLDNMKPRAVAQLLEQIVNIVFSLLFAALWYKYGLYVACAGGCMGTPISALVSLIYLMVYYHKHKTIDKPLNPEILEVKRISNRGLTRRVLSYGIPITICWGMQYAGNLVDTINNKGRLLASGLSVDKSDILFGNLGKYTTLIGVPLSIITALSAAVLPMIASYAALNNKKEIKRGIDYSFNTAFLVAVPCAMGLAILSEPIYILLGPSFEVGYELMTYGGWILILASLIQIQTIILQSLGRLYKTALNMFLGIVVKVGINYILITNPKINITGALVGSAFGYLIPVVLNKKLIEDTLEIKLSLFHYFKNPFISSLIMGVAAYITHISINYTLSIFMGRYLSNAVATILAIVVSMVVYLYMMIRVGGFRKKDLEVFPSRVVSLIPNSFIKRMS